MINVRESSITPLTFYDFAKSLLRAKAFRTFAHLRNSQGYVYFAFDQSVVKFFLFHIFFVDRYFQMRVDRSAFVQVEQLDPNVIYNQYVIREIGIPVTLDLKRTFMSSLF